MDLSSAILDAVGIDRQRRAAAALGVAVVLALQPVPAGAYQDGSTTSSSVTPSSTTTETTAAPTTTTTEAPTTTTEAPTTTTTAAPTTTTEATTTTTAAPTTTTAEPTTTTTSEPSTTTTSGDLITAEDGPAAEADDAGASTATTSPFLLSVTETPQPGPALDDGDLAPAAGSSSGDLVIPEGARGIRRPTPTSARAAIGTVRPTSSTTTTTTAVSTPSTAQFEAPPTPATVSSTVPESLAYAEESGSIWKSPVTWILAALLLMLLVLGRMGGRQTAAKGDDVDEHLA